MLTSRFGGVRGLSYSQRYTNKKFSSRLGILERIIVVRAAAAAAAGLEAGGDDDLQHLANTVHRHS